MHDMTPSRVFANTLAWALVAVLFAVVGTCLIGLAMMIKELF